MPKLGLRAGFFLPFFIFNSAFGAHLHSISGNLNSHPPTLPPLTAGKLYGVLVSANEPAKLGNGRLRVSLLSGATAVLEKDLHRGDGDLYSVIKAHGNEKITIRPELGASLATPYLLKVTELGSATNIAFEPNNRWQDSNPITLNKTIFASGDESSYYPQEKGGTTRESASNPKTDWFRFEFNQPKPKLIHFAIDLTERDNLPVDISIWRLDAKDASKVEPFHDGEDPVALPHEVQALNGNKFTVRTLSKPGTYFIRVAANHPEYKLRTRTYEAPPYAAVEDAVQSAVDYIVAAGDSWHANTPRRGGVFNRVSSVHQETSLCVACHATHFPQRAQLYALRNGYELNNRQPLQFLAERFYNNPRPFYGFEQDGAVWARVISAPVNVLSRMSHLLRLFETEVSGVPRPAYHEGIAKYIRLYYEGRTKLPNDETNGNTPLVSTYEVAWYAWESTRDGKIAALIEQDDHKNLIDLCYQTLALAAIDPFKYAEKLKSNAARILALQRPSGQWSMHFSLKEHEVEFQTGHALWALSAAGIPRDNPQIKKAIDHLLSRQQPFGGWLDPLQSFENFRTPFRETQMAILGLSSYYPKSKRQAGWGVAAPKSYPVDADAKLVALDATWTAPPTSLLKEIVNEDTLIRQQATEALGRIGSTQDDLVTLTGRLGDPSKLVARTAAWSIRQLYSRYPALASTALITAMTHNKERVRWGATRVFATHFSALAKRTDLAEPLALLASDSSPAIQAQALKGLWQFWFWAPDDSSKEKIEDTLLASLNTVQHPWAERNLKEAIYNISDENIRYLYNNWIPLLGTEASRNTAIAGRLRLESRLAEKFATVLDQGNTQSVKLLLTSLTEFELRRGDVYDLKADLSTPFPPVYSRIGNDVEQIVFFGKSNDRLAKALKPYLESSDRELRRVAENASILLRDAPFSEVVKQAGKPGADREQIFTKLKERMPESTPILRAAGRAPVEPRRPGTAGPRPGGASVARPDEAYFRGYVEPILTSRGKDGYACVHCHASHAIFDGSVGSAQRVINLEAPEESLILRKPTTDAESEGTINASKLSHGGGIRFDVGSPEYNTILNWIRGTKP